LKIRIKFQKDGVMKFVGHLDLMRYFQRAIRRANIDICYSEGFSPHQIMSFASPLGVGITSDGEYLDIEVNSTSSTEDAINALNTQMVEGIRIVGYKVLPDQSKNSASIIASGEYILSYREGYESPYNNQEWIQALDDIFFSQSEFLIVKKTKKSEKEVDLKPLVYSLEIENSKESIPAFHMMVATGSQNNLKPELLLASLYEKLNLDYNPIAFQIHRIDLFAQDENNQFVSLGDMGENI